MAVSTGSYLKNFYDATVAYGAKAVNSDFTIEIEGFEDYYLLSKQAPWPELTPAGEIEIATPMGATMWQAQQVKVAQQGQIAMYETAAGTISQMLVDLLVASGSYRGAYGTFNCRVYDGTPQHYTACKRLIDCFLQLDPVDRDWENRSQVLMFQGTLFYHYFGDKITGNSLDYR